MQGQEPDGLSLAALRTTLAATSPWAFAQSIFLTTALFTHGVFEKKHYAVAD